MPTPALELCQRLWEWLPARTDRSRHTDPATIALHLGVPAAQVAHTLSRMERGGYALRDRQTGRRAQQWHRGKPYPAAAPADADPEEPGLWP